MAIVYFVVTLAAAAAEFYLYASHVRENFRPDVPIGVPSSALFQSLRFFRIVLLAPIRLLIDRSGYSPPDHIAAVVLMFLINSIIVGLLCWVVLILTARLKGARRAT